MVAAATPVAEPAQQLKNELNGSIRRAIAAQRPILTHVNADSTWLLQLPAPNDASPGGRDHFNILIDPWLQGPQSDVAAWFSTQWHAIPSSVQTIAELEERLADVFQIAYQMRHGDRPLRAPAILPPEHSYIDAIVICHEFTDHCHEATLREIHSSVPVFASDKAADLIRSWRHFDTVYTTPPFSPDQTDWRKTSLPPLTPWIGISRVVSPGNALYYHSAILIAVRPATPPAPGWPTDGAEAVIYSPHGIAPTDLVHLAAAQPRIRTLALLHGLNDVQLPRFQLNLGAHNGLQAHRATRPRYWVGCHDEPKTGGGMVGWFLRRGVISLQEAVDKARQEAEERGLKDVDYLEDINFLEMQSGESILLE